MIEHSLVNAGATRNFVDPGISETHGGKLLGRRREDSLARNIRIAFTGPRFGFFQRLFTHANSVSNQYRRTLACFDACIDRVQPIF